MRFKPHEYQSFCVDFIEEKPCCALLLDMGLGKTVTTLTAIKNMMDRGAVKKVLVIAPLRVARDTWPDEIEKWDHLQGITVSKIIGTRKQRDEAVAQPADIYIINRENVPYLVENFRWDYDMVVIDELSSFKNAQSKRFRSLKAIRRKTARWIGLTGTPAPNGLLDLWPEMYLIDGGERLGRYITHYREKYFRIKSMNPTTGIVYEYSPLPGAEDAIYDKLSDIVVSMKAKDFLQMPDLIFSDESVRMDLSEKQSYNDMKLKMVAEIENVEIDAKNAGSLAGKLAQMANGAVYGDGGEVLMLHKAKLDKLEDLIESANGQPVLVAYWFKHDRARILERCSEMGVKAVPLTTSEDLKNWNDGIIPVALIHPASAGHGLNIQRGGHILIWFSLVWSLELYQQTNARLWRQGQEHVVTVHHIVCEDTIDEDIIKALNDKDVTQERLIKALRARIA